MINHNKYFNDTVQSLAYTNSQGKFSVGVMTKGEYTFNTEAAEKMTLVQGHWTIKLDGKVAYEGSESGSSVDIPANSSFDLIIAEDTAYLCEYL